MGSFGDKMRSRWRTRRLLKRSATAVLFVALGFLFFLFLLFYALRSETFWRAYIIDAYGGDYWRTVLRWDEFESTALPPRVRVTNLRMMEPGGGPVLQIAELDFEATWRLYVSQEDLHIRRFHARGISVNHVVYKDGTSNLDRAVERFLDGRPPVRTQNGWRRGVAEFPDVYVEDARLRELSLRHEDRRRPEAPLVLTFTDPDAIALTFDQDGVPQMTSAEGDFDEFTRLVAEGPVSLTAGSWGWQAQGRADLVVEDLEDFPHNDGTLAIVLAAAGNPQIRLLASGKILFERFPVRPVATPWSSVQVAVQGPSGEPLVELNDGALDPLQGTLRAELMLGSGLGPLIEAGEAFLIEQDRGRLRGAVPAWLRELPLRAGVQLESRGAIQYAIMDPQEQLPASIEASGFVETEAIELQTAEGPLPVVVQLRGVVEARQDLGKAQASLLAELRSRDPQHPASVTAALTGPGEGGKFVFNPFQQNLLESLGRRWREAAPAADAAEGSQAEAFHPIMRRLQQAVPALFASARQLQAAPLKLEAAGQAGARLLRTAGVPPELLASQDGRTSATVSLLLDAPAAHGMFLAEVESTGLGLLQTGEPQELMMHGRVHLEPSRVETRDFSLALREEGGSNRLVALAPALRSLLSGVSPGVAADLDTGSLAFSIALESRQREALALAEGLVTMGMMAPGGEATGPLMALYGFGENGERRLREPVRQVVSGRLNGAAVLKVETDVPEPALGPLAQALPPGQRLRLVHTLERDGSTARPGPLELELVPAAGPADGEPTLRLRFQPDMATAASFPELQRALLQRHPFAGPAEFLETLEELSQSFSGAGSTLELEIPHLQLDPWLEPLRRAGIPVSGAGTGLQLQAQLPAAPGEPIALSGDGVLRDVVLAGGLETLPSAAYRFRATYDGAELQVDSVRLYLPLQESGPPLLLRGGGRGNLEQGTATWKASLTGLQTATPRVLSLLRIGGTGLAARLLQALPTGSVLEMAGGSGSLRLELEGERTPAGDAVLHVTQLGDGLRVFPVVLDPLRLEVFQRLRLPAGGGAPILEEVRGVVQEAGAGEPLARLHLEAPLVLQPHAVSPLVLTMSKPLEPVAARLRRLPLPLLERPVVSGTLSGVVRMEVPGGLFDSAAPLGDLRHTFAVTLEDLVFEGHDKRVAATLTGELLRLPDRLMLEAAQLETRLAGQEAGAATLEATYYLTTEVLEGTLALEGMRAGWLRAFPPPLGELADGKASSLSSRSGFRVEMASDKATVDTGLRWHNLALPPVRLPNGQQYQHPPLQVQGSLTASFDGVTSVVLVQDLNFVIAQGDAEGPEGKDEPVTKLRQEPLLAVQQFAPLVVDAQTLEFAAQEGTSGGLDLRVGPADIGPYSPLLLGLLGVPLESGVLQGQGAVLASQGPGMNVDVAGVDLSLRDGVWRRPSGQKIPIEGGLFLKAQRRPQAIRLEELTVRLAQQDLELDEGQHLQIRGFYEAEGETDNPSLELAIHSERFWIDRISRLIEDVEFYRGQLRSPAAGEVEGEPGGRRQLEPLRIPASLRANLLVELEDLRLRFLRIPRLVTHGTLENGVLVLEDLRARTVPGTLEGALRANLNQGPVAWEAQLQLSGANASTWLSSLLSPSAGASLTGVLAATAAISGEGFSPGSLRHGLRAQANLQLREGEARSKPLQLIFGVDPGLEVDATAIIRDNRGHLEAVTPWTPTRDVLLRGTLYHLFPRPDEEPYLRAFVDSARTTAVGPQSRQVLIDGQPVPLRQTLFGVRMEVTGPLEGAESSRDGEAVRLRSFQYE